MRARERAPAQPRVVEQRALLHQLADRSEAPVLELADVEISPRRAILRPTQKDVARRLHDALALDHAAARVILELRAEALEHGLAGFLDLQEQRGAVAAHEQADGTEGADAADADHLEGDVLERIAFEQTKPLRRQPVPVQGEHALGVDPMPRVASLAEMVDARRPVLDARLLALHQVREVVVLFDAVGGLGEDVVELTPQRAVVDVLDFLRQLDLAVPVFQRRHLGERAHAGAVGFDGRG